MKIKKLGHCCLVIEAKGKSIMTDPGVFSTKQDEEKNIDIVLVTHEHADHFHIDSLKKVLRNNPDAVVVTNAAVGKLLDAEHIAHQILDHGGSANILDVLIEGIGEHHAEIYKELGQVENTGFFIENTLFYPGDAFTDPHKHVDILALPVAGPWMKIKDAIEYALLLKPRVAFPVHDAVLKNPSMSQGMLGNVLQEEGISFVPLNEGDEQDL